jgi:hypothetical protein
MQLNASEHTMEKQLIRVGIDYNISEAVSSNFYALDAVFGGDHELVNIPDFYPYKLVNGTWTGALGHLMNGNP